MAGPRRTRRVGPHRCGVMTEDGRPCRRRLRNQPYCDRHSGGTPVGSPVGTASPRTAPGLSRLTGAAHRDAERAPVPRRAEATIEIAYVRTAVDLVQELATQ